MNYVVPYVLGHFKECIINRRAPRKCNCHEITLPICPKCQKAKSFGIHDCNAPGIIK